jgi:hypothetical protein
MVCMMCVKLEDSPEDLFAWLVVVFAWGS